MDWWKENWKQFMTMLFSFLTTLATALYAMHLGTKTAKLEIKTDDTATKQAYIQVQTNAAQANAEVAAAKVGEPVVKPDWDQAVKQIEAQKAAEAK